MTKNKEWLKNEVNELPLRFLGFSVLKQREEFAVIKDDVLDLIDQLDEPEVLSQEWIDEHEIHYNHWVGAVPVTDLQNLLVPKQEEPTQEQVQKYLSEHGIGVVENEPETVADVISDFWKSFERLKKVMSMAVEELEE